MMRLTLGSYGMTKLMLISSKTTRLMLTSLFTMYLEDNHIRDDVPEALVDVDTSDADIPGRCK